MNELVFAAAFYALAGLTVASAAGVVFLKNIVHSAFLLALAFVGVAGIYLLLNADFLSAVQVLVYGGAVAILVAFGVMLVQRRDMKSSNPEVAWSGLGFAVAMITLVVSALATVLTKFPVQEGAEFSVEGLSRELLTNYVVPFEAAAVLLLVAMLGAIILAKGAKEA